MSIDRNKPVYTIGVAADLAGISQDTLRNYEDVGLIKPHRTSKNRRLYTQAEVEWASCIRELIKQGHNIVSLKKILKYESCYQLKGCSEEVIQNCQAAKERLYEK